MNAYEAARREDEVIQAVLRCLPRWGDIETCAATHDPVNSPDPAERLIAEHGFDAGRVIALKSLARSRGVSLEVVLRAAMRGDLVMVVELPPVVRSEER